MGRDERGGGIKKKEGERGRGRNRRVTSFPGPGHLPLVLSERPGARPGERRAGCVEAIRDAVKRPSSSSSKGTKNWVMPGAFASWPRCCCCCCCCGGSPEARRLPAWRVSRLRRCGMDAALRMGDFPSDSGAAWRDAGGAGGAWLTATGGCWGACPLAGDAALADESNRCSRSRNSFCCSGPRRATCAARACRLEPPLAAMSASTWASV